MSRQIPILSMRDYLQNPQDFAQKIGEGFRDFGFVGITDHGIADSLLETAYGASKDFFALPLDTKKKYDGAEFGGARGYTGMRIETAVGASQPDEKEFFHIGRDPVSADEKLLANIFPNELAHYEPAMRGLYGALEKLGDEVLSALALYLGLDKDWFANKTNRGDSILRPIHYPPALNVPDGATRAGAHTDINLITLLIGSNEAGLEIQERDGSWIAVTTIPGTIVINMGDMMERLTNHHLRSTVHRVVIPDGKKAAQPRYSMPYFLHGNADWLIETLPQCVTPENPDRYAGRSITENQFLAKRLYEINLIKLDNPHFAPVLAGLLERGELELREQDRGKQIASAPVPRVA